MHQVVTADVPSGERPHALRHDDCFGLFNEIGDIDAETRSEAGLYRAGVRHLSRLTLTIAWLRPLLLAADAARRQRAADDESHQPRRARRGRPHHPAARHAVHHALAFHLGRRVPRDDPRAQFRAEHGVGGTGDPLRLGFREHRRRARAAAHRRRPRALRARRARQRDAGLPRRGRSGARDRGRLPHRAGGDLRRQPAVPLADRQPRREDHRARHRLPLGEPARCRSPRSRVRWRRPRSWRAPRAGRDARSSPPTRRSTAGCGAPPPTSA